VLWWVNARPATRSARPTLLGPRWVLILTAKYVLLFVSSSPHNGGGYVNGTLLSPLTAMPLLSSREFPPAPSFSKPHATQPGVLRGQRAKVELEERMVSDRPRVCGDGERSVGGHESFSDLSPVGLRNGLGLPLQLWDISPYDKEMCVCPAAYTSCPHTSPFPPADSR